jgi:hypothetical protein
MPARCWRAVCPVAVRTSEWKGAVRPSPQATAAKRSPRARDGAAGVVEAASQAMDNPYLTYYLYYFMIVKTRI